MKQFHFILQAKGGVGKSFLVYLLALKHQSQPGTYFVDVDASTQRSSRQLAFLSGTGGYICSYATFVYCASIAPSGSVLKRPKNVLIQGFTHAKMMHDCFNNCVLLAEYLITETRWCFLPIYNDLLVQLLN